MSNNKVLLSVVLLGLVALTACSNQGNAPSATPTVDPDIFNQVPKTTVFEPGECTVTLDEPTPAWTSNTLGGEPGGEIPAGNYEVGVAADYGTSLWYQLNDVGEINYISSTSVAANAPAVSSNTSP